MKLLGRYLVVKHKDICFITNTLRGKDLVLGKVIVSGATTTMGGPFGSLFAVVKVSTKRRS